MPEINEKDLGQAIKEGRFAPLYLFYGEEDYLKRVYIERILKAAVTDFEETNLHRLDGSASADDITSAADAIPMMSEYSCVVVSDYQFASISELQFKQFKAVLEQPNESCVLIFAYESALPKPKSDKGKELFNLLCKRAHTINFTHKTEKELADAICRRAARRSINLQPTIARGIIQRCGDNLENLLNETDKLCDYVGAGAAVTMDDVEVICSKTVEASSFALADAVCAGNSDLAMSICADLFEARTEPLLILGALSGVFVDIYRVKLGEAEGMRTDDLANAFGYGKAAFKLRRAAQSGKRMSQGSVRKALEILRSTDLALKGSRTEAKIIMERCLVELTRTVSGRQL